MLGDVFFCQKDGYTVDNKTGGFRGGVLLGVELDLVGVEDVTYPAKILLHLNMDNDFVSRPFTIDGFFSGGRKITGGRA